MPKAAERLHAAVSAGRAEMRAYADYRDAPPRRARKARAHWETVLRERDRLWAGLTPEDRKAVIMGQGALSDAP